MSKKKKKKLTPKQIEEKERRKNIKKAAQKKNRTLSLIATVIGCLIAAFIVPTDDMAMYMVLCVVAGLVCGGAADLLIVLYNKSKEKNGIK